MDTNYDKGINALREVSNDWKLRYFTVFGKICVIKMLMLAKMTHIANILPDITRKKVEQIENNCCNVMRLNKRSEVDTTIG